MALIDLLAFLRIVVVRALGQHDVGLVVVRQVVQGGDDVPAVHLALVDLLGAVIEAGGVAEADRVGGREQAEGRMRLGSPWFWSSRVSLPSTSSTRWITNITSGRPASYSSNTRAVRVLQRPGQQAFAELGDLLAVAQHDGVLADQVDAADVAVQVDPDAGPVQARGDLLDMGRLAGAVVALDHDAAVVGKAGQDGQGGVVVEAFPKPQALVTFVSYAAGSTNDRGLRRQR